MESEKGSEFRERGSVFKQMAEMKKKIQLVEGERKAIFEDCESEKQTNKDKIKKMKDEVKFLQVKNCKYFDFTYSLQLLAVCYTFVTVVCL